MKVLFTVFVLLLSNFLGAFAQTPSWQWGRRGGSNKILEPDFISDLATDPNGNVYILSQARYTAGSAFTLDVAGNTLVGQGEREAILSSFTCNGIYRWSKVLGSQKFDAPLALGTDTLGGVYTAIRMYRSANANSAAEEFHIANDSTIPSGTNKTLLLVKYDTAGNYQWARTPQDAGTTSSLTAGIDMEVDGNGNVYWLCKLNTGSYQNSLYTLTVPKISILKYDKNGTAGGTLTLDISTPATNMDYLFSKMYLTRNPGSGTFYLSGYGTANGSSSISFGSVLMNQSAFIAAFTATGTALWVQKNSINAFGSNFSEISLDGSNNLYLAGVGRIGDSIAGSAPYASNYYHATTPTTVSLALSLDSNGNLRWLKQSDGAAVVSRNVGAYINGYFLLAGDFSETIRWPGLNDSLVKAPIPNTNTTTSIYTTRFNAATGQPLAFDSLVSSGISNYEVDLLKADRRENLYLAGQFENTITIAGTYMQAANISTSDFFLAKYGYAGCNCVVPVAAITQSNYNNATRSVTFRYTGSTAGVDSVVWAWGNNQSPVKLFGNFITAPVQRFYGNDTGTYNVCVTAYTNCSNQKVCTPLRFTSLGMGLEQFPAAGSKALLQLFPNPAASATVVTYILQGNSGSLEVYDLAGRLLSNKAVNGKTGTETLSLRDYAAGVYMVVLREEAGATQYRRLVIAK